MARTTRHTYIQAVLDEGDYVPVPSSLFREEIREAINASPKPIREGLAVLDLLNAASAGKIKPRSYYAKAWGWTESAAYRLIRRTVSGVNSKRTGSEQQANSKRTETLGNPQGIAETRTASEQEANRKRTGSEQVLSEKIREEENKNPPTPHKRGATPSRKARPPKPTAADLFAELEIPPTLDTPTFRTAWLAWLDHRLTRAKPKDWRVFFLAQLGDLETRGVEVATATLRQSTLNGWTGLFPEKQSETRHGATGKHPAPSGKGGERWTKEGIESSLERFRQYEHHSPLDDLLRGTAVDPERVRERRKGADDSVPD